MSISFSNNPIYWALIILASATCFTILWGVDALTHKKLVHIDIHDKELQTHRNILKASFLMEISLVLMYWEPVYMLPFFIAFFITRLAHEFIDELHFHTERCSKNETNLHLYMWFSVLIKTFAMFMWGFFFKYKGINELPFLIYVWAGIVLLVMSYISLKEWKR